MSCSFGDFEYKFVATVNKIVAKVREGSRDILKCIVYVCMISVDSFLQELINQSTNSSYAGFSTHEHPL